MIKTKIVSSLEKALLTQNIDEYKDLKKLSALRGERISFQLLHTYIFEEISPNANPNRANATISAKGELAKYASFRDVSNVAVTRPTLETSGDDDGFISKEPGLFPDLLLPIVKNKLVCVTARLLLSVWIDITVPSDIKAGEYATTVTLECDGQKSESTVVIEIINATLPEESIYFTQWFHTDCLANYYNVDVWSERHWEIIENFARVAVKNGINLLLTPVFTPPLDTEQGGERKTTQLVGVTLSNKEYSFDFTLLDRWIEMCDRVGIKYFEISHLFTQWGAKHAPKIMASVDGEYKKIFGWETDSCGEEYTFFLRTFLREFISHMKKKGRDKDCFFHISDEPARDHIEFYKAAKATVADLLKDYTIMDALSKYDFWTEGVVSTPIPASNHIAPFIEGKVPNLWTYYCCSQIQKVSNRFISMPSARNRSIGFQMYKYDIVGFLHWGYNFYNNYLSRGEINPFVQQDGNAWITPGDAYSVYPAQNGEALESIRIIVFAEALADLRAMRLCEKYYGKDTIVNIIEEEMGVSVTFETCTTSPDVILNIRERVNQLIKKAVEKY